MLDPMSQPEDADSPTLRQPTVEDAAAIWRLTRDSGVLDLNSSYSYLLVCSHHAATSIVAERAGRVVGFVSAYRLPRNPEALFVWQVGIDERHRRGGLATGMLVALLERPTVAGVRFVEATVTPSNGASWRLFHSLARRLGARLEVAEGFRRRHFPGGGHEPEELLRIGPIQGTGSGHEEEERA
ncbi:MAG: diaminobutyrate acetyltransferase [bacterium]|nr:diaminobutyrate acetyltransferase [bacterium]